MDLGRKLKVIGKLILYMIGLAFFLKCGWGLLSLFWPIALPILIGAFLIVIWAVR